MDRGPSYSLHEDGDAPNGWKGSALENGEMSVMMRPSAQSASREPLRTPRIMDRKDVEMKRSKGQWNIRRVKTPNYWRLYLKDPFHTVVNLRLSKVIGVMMIVYIAVLVIYAALYTTVPLSCKTSIYSFYDGFSFSTSVMFTIGFGSNGGDVFFNGCAWMQTLITTQSLVGVMLDALAIGVIFARISRAQSRANTIVLSTNACARRIRGQRYFMFQVCEMRKHQLVEAHVRMYAIRHDVAYGKHYYFQSYPMRIQHPDDDLGGMLLLALPSVVVHRMDAWSPLLPPKNADCCGLHHNPAHEYLFPEPVMRQADADSGDRDSAVPLDTTSRNVPCRCKTPTGEPTPQRQLSVEEIKQFWRDSQLEVVVLVEGIDAVTSATIQVRHSYRADEILFDHSFVNCVDIDPETGGAVVDFLRFHETEPADPECIKVSGGFY